MKRPKSKVFRYPAKLIRVIDGDTVDLEVDLGFYVKLRLRFRLLGINTPELHSKNPEERKKAQEAKEFVQKIFEKNGNECVVESFKTGKYGRWLANIYFGDECLNEILLKEGLAKEYE